jgi:HK97 family phage prohead protease
MEKQFKNINLLTDEGDKGKVSAVFSVFNEIDSDGDVVLPQSIKSGYGENGVAMVWGHDWKDVIGRGEILEEDGRAVFKGQFIMDTQRGRDAYETVKAMGDIQQWSFGYEVLDSENGMFTKDGKEEVEVRYLKSLKVWEVSPVLVGANQNTHTLAVKEKNTEGLKFTDEIERVRNTLNAVINRAQELTSIRLEKGKKLSEKSSQALIDLNYDLHNAYTDLNDLLDAGVKNEDMIKNTEDDKDLFLRTMAVLTDTSDI